MATINPYLVSRKPRDPGTAIAVTSLERRIRRLEGTYGVLGAGATITAPVIQTADVGAKVSLSAFGVLYTNSSGSVTMGLIPGQGLNLLAGSHQENSITWVSSIPGNVQYASISSYLLSGTTSAQLVLAATTPDQSGNSTVTIQAQNATDGISNGIIGNVFGVASRALLMNSIGGGSWPGALSATAFNVSSDESTKDGVKDLGDEHVESLKYLRPVQYRNTEDGEEYLGFVAQEVQSRLPQIIKTTIRLGQPEESTTELESINLSSLIAVLVKGYQHLEQRISTMESENTDE